MPHDHAKDTRHRKAQCGCGNLRVEITGEPERVYACSCLECQRLTGSVLAYRARYPADAVLAMEGERRIWRRRGGSGRIWIEYCFCPNCGTTLFCRVEGGNAVMISVGAFADPAFEAPSSLYWASRRHKWLTPDSETRCIDEQS